MTTSTGEKVLQAFETRAARAELLAPGSAAAEGPLRFAALLLRAQGQCAAAIAVVHQASPLAGKLEDDGPRLLPAWQPLLRSLAEQGPAGLASDARDRLASPPEELFTDLGAYWGIGSFDYGARALIRPWAETLAALAIVPDRSQSGPPATDAPCPFCGGPPLISLRRAGAEGDGTPRSLVCSLCSREQLYSRIRCPKCGEADPHKLPAFRSEQHANTRIECCDTCRHYVKSIDLSLDARPIGEVDDLLTLSLDLWAAESKLTRIEPGLAGL